jgi:hypothetical protein
MNATTRLVVAELTDAKSKPERRSEPCLRLCEARNGRALADNAPEVMFSIVVNAALSDGLRRGTGTLRPDFPYVALPVSAGK